MAKDPLKKLVEKNASDLYTSLRMDYMKIPSRACTCGKPVVFVPPRKTFKCSRCGSGWRMNITITEAFHGTLLG